MRGRHPNSIRALREHGRHGSAKRTGTLCRQPVTRTQLEDHRELVLEDIGDEVSRVMARTDASEAHVSRLAGGNGRLKHALYRLRRGETVSVNALIDLALVTDHDLIVTFKQRAA